MCESQTSAVPPLNQMHMLHNEAHFVKVIRCLQVNYFKISQGNLLGSHCHSVHSCKRKFQPAPEDLDYLVQVSSVSKVKVKWYLAKYGDPYSEFVLWIEPIQVHTHTVVNTLPEHWAAICCGARGSVGGLVTYSMVSPQSDLRLELATFRLQVQLSNH